MKRLFALILCFVLTVFAAPSAYASGISPLALPDDPPVAPLWENISKARADLSIDGGSAAIYCYSSGESGVVTNVRIEAKLQRSSGLFWFAVETFTVENASYYAVLSRTCAVESGYSYRIKATVTVYSSSGSESATVKSNVVEY